MRCIAFRFHNWGKWSEPIAVNTRRSAGSFGDSMTVTEMYQQRVCLRCNATQMRKVVEGEVLETEGKR